LSVTDRLAEVTSFMRAALLNSGLERVERDGSVYFRGGAGNETLVLLHGANDQAGTWAGIIPALKNRYRLILPDLSGHGESSPATGPLELSAMVAQLHEILENETNARVTLVGNSMGGWVAMLYALEHPERVAQLVLEAAGGMSWPVATPLFAYDRETAVTILHAVHGPDVKIEEWWIDALLARATGSPMARVTEAGVQRHLVDGRLASLRLPATLIWGEHDGVLPLAYAKALQAQLAGSRLLIVEGAAHIPHQQRPERFVECLNSTFSANARA
jgi:pimeloyl-ACP methyl ester carboxylesterase